MELKDYELWERTKDGWTLIISSTQAMTRQAALRLGYSTYQGEPCEAGHSGTRLTRNSRCVECKGPTGERRGPKSKHRYVINGVHYNTRTDVANGIGLSHTAIDHRCESPSFPEWHHYVYDVEVPKVTLKRRRPVGFVMSDEARARIRANRKGGWPKNGQKQE